MMRAFGLLTLLLALLWAVPNAQAADCHTSEENCPQASAYAACRADMSRRQGEGFTISVACVQGGTQQLPYYECRYSNAGGNGCGYNPSGHALYRWNSTSSCSTKPSLLNVAYGGTLGGCSAGCEYAPGIGEPGDSVTRVGSGAQSITRVARMVPTGAACVVGEDFKEVQTQTTDQCQQQGNLTQCLTADGRTCTVGRSGKKYCWQPTEAGIKVSGNEGATKAPEGTSIKPPPKAPNNGGDWQQGGTGTVSVTAGGTTNNYNTTNWNSSYGNQGSGANGGGADGEGNGGSGDGSGEGDGDDGWGEPGGGVGDLYEGTDKTVAGLVGQFWDQARAAPVFQGVTNFMGINAAGGACPVFTLTASDFWNTMTFDAHCSGNWLALLQAMGWVVFALASYVAVRIAVT